MSNLLEVRAMKTQHFRVSSESRTLWCDLVTKETKEPRLPRRYWTRKSLWKRTRSKIQPWNETYLFYAKSARNSRMISTKRCNTLKALHTNTTRLNRRIKLYGIHIKCWCPNLSNFDRRKLNSRRVKRRNFNTSWRLTCWRLMLSSSKGSMSI